jgi:hypothetical protein
MTVPPSSAPSRANFVGDLGCFHIFDRTLCGFTSVAAFTQEKLALPQVTTM